jgi:hypothetical protein
MMSLGLSSFAHASIKCWQNQDGVRECGSILPPEYASKEHEVRNSKAIVIDKIGREKSKKERQAILDAETLRMETEIKYKQQEKKDRQLLDLYPTENDIFAARDSKFTSIDAGIRMTNGQLNFYLRSLKESKKVYADQIAIKNKDKITKEGIEKREKSIQKLTKQIKRFKHFIADKKSEKERINTEFSQYLERHREIKQRFRALRQKQTEKFKKVESLK